MLSVEPGKTWGPATGQVPLVDLSQIPTGTLLITLAGDQDQLVREQDAKRIYKETTRIPTRDKDFVLLQSDNHGKPALAANHFAPVAPSRGMTGIARPRLTLTVANQSPLVEGDGGPVRGRRRVVRPAVAEGGNFVASGINTLDYYGTWKLFDALLDAGLYNRNRNIALGNTPEQRFMGKWSDGVPVKPLLVSDPQ